MSSAECDQRLGGSWEWFEFKRVWIGRICNITAYVLSADVILITTNNANDLRLLLKEFFWRAHHIFVVIVCSEPLRGVQLKLNKTTSFPTHTFTVIITHCQIMTLTYT